ncbi:hypothetical protein PYCCODRAFT_459149 [Trametes coccinea BRFM310]|uniref:Uncharacterized protein n=1 Tax=Trametes coccinea (strain BRFM310) TaxID=1353009 RepID=A0A1Y2ILD2_TRAC3|nr:hypothetical protein PYCCODRAFT_459149 [Trametes coccinea BRFM310]
MPSSPLLVMWKIDSGLPPRSAVRPSCRLCGRLSTKRSPHAHTSVDVIIHCATLCSVLCAISAHDPLEYCSIVKFGFALVEHGR